MMSIVAMTSLTDDDDDDDIGCLDIIVDYFKTGGATLNKE